LGQNLDSYFSHSLKLPVLLTTVVVDAAFTEAAVSAVAYVVAAAAAAQPLLMVQLLFVTVLTCPFLITSVINLIRNRTPPVV